MLFFLKIIVRYTEIKAHALTLAGMLAVSAFQTKPAPMGAIQPLFDAVFNVLKEPGVPLDVKEASLQSTVCFGCVMFGLC